ncbi:MAG: ATP-binding protein [Tannerella sp.]|jgi:hypothetical protein|nr:ATP-binding protein [Tannerella sp.]
MAKKTKELNVMEHIEKIVIGSKKSGFTQSKLQKLKPQTEVVGQLLDISHEQVILLSVIINLSDTNTVSLHDLSRYFDCPNIRLMCHRKDLDELANKKLLKFLHRHDPFDGQKDNVFIVPSTLIECLQTGKKYVPESYKNYTAKMVFDLLSTWFSRLEEGNLRIDTLKKKLGEMMLNNQKLPLFKSISKYKLSEQNTVMLLFFCHKLVNEEDTDIHIHEVTRSFWDLKLSSERNLFKNGKGQLFDAGLLEYSKAEEMGDPNKYSLTDKAKDELLVGFDIDVQQVKNMRDIILPENIKAKELFYNEKEQAQITRLESLLQEQNFKEVQDRLANNGMHRGFACLFYGAPGTGKTETVYQLARQTGREIFLVDISQTKSMWFGESEKIIKNIFYRYEAMLKVSTIAPILLFNEADAIIGKRKDVTKGNVAQTENAIQNIILQEIENLNGILIATTNLTDNLDNAFERRFLYKIEFGKPKTEAKQAIWKTMLPQIPNEAVSTLASRFDFSGGQIENIARKCVVDSIITGQAPAIETLLEHCNNELLTKSRRPVGFVV